MAEAQGKNDKPYSEGDAYLYETYVTEDGIEVPPPTRVMGPRRLARYREDVAKYLRAMGRGERPNPVENMGSLVNTHEIDPRVLAVQRRFAALATQGSIELNANDEEKLHEPEPLTSSMRALRPEEIKANNSSSSQPQESLHVEADDLTFTSSIPIISPDTSPKMHQYLVRDEPVVEGEETEATDASAESSPATSSQPAVAGQNSAGTQSKKAAAPSADEVDENRINVAPVPLNLPSPIRAMDAQGLDLTVLDDDKSDASQNVQTEKTPTGAVSAQKAAAAQNAAPRTGSVPQAAAPSTGTIPKVDNPWNRSLSKVPPYLGTKGYNASAQPGTFPKVSSRTGSTPKVNPRTGSVSQVASSRTGAVPKVPSRTGSVPQVSNRTGSTPKVSSRTGATPKVNPRTGSVSQVASSRTGAVPKVPSRTGSVPQVSNRTGATPKVNPATGSSPQVKQGAASVKSPATGSTSAVKPSTQKKGAQSADKAENTKSGFDKALNEGKNLTSDQATELARRVSARADQTSTVKSNAKSPRRLGNTASMKQVPTGSAADEAVSKYESIDETENKSSSILTWVIVVALILLAILGVYMIFNQR